MAAQQGQLVARALPRLHAPWTRHESPLPVANEVFGLRARAGWASAPPAGHYSLLLSIWRFRFFPKRRHALSKGGETLQCTLGVHSAPPPTKDPQERGACVNCLTMQIRGRWQPRT